MQAMFGSLKNRFSQEAQGGTKKFGTFAGVFVPTILFVEGTQTAMKEQVINVWLREQGPQWQLGLRLVNMGLALLLAYQLMPLASSFVMQGMKVRWLKDVI